MMLTNKKPQTNQSEKKIPSKPLTPWEKRFYPLLNLPFLEMEGNLVAKFHRANSSSPESTPYIVTYSGKTYDLDSYLECRVNWSTEGYIDDLGNEYLFPEYQKTEENGVLPPEILNYPYIAGGWSTYQHRVERAYHPLTISKLNGDILELPGLSPNSNPLGKAWCTERDLVKMIRQTYPEDKDLESHFKLVMSNDVANLGDLNTLQNFNFVDFNKWKLLLDGNMPLELMLIYLDEEETSLAQHVEDRASTPLRFIQEDTPDEVLTLEDWAELPPIENLWINIQDRLKEKYPKLKESTFLLQVSLPCQKEPTQIETIFLNRMDPTTRQRIIEAKTPLEVKLSFR